MNSAGVSGYEGASTGQVMGVSGNARSSTQYSAGVGGYEGSATGQVYGVNGSTNSATTNAAGVGGFENAASGQVYGVYGTTNSAGPYAAGVGGFANTSTNQVYGVYGNASSTNGIGVFGVAGAASGLAVGVEGLTFSSGGTGGQFVNVSGSGLILEGQAGKSYTTVFSVDTSGNLKISGKLTQSGIAARIDHPLDPANKYLSHSAVESPDMKNFYDGIVTLDAAGSAEVILPDWFEALNRDFRYQLTCVGGYAPVYIAAEISGNRFRIAGGQPGLRVSWAVTGIRKDAYAVAHPVVVEELKEEQNRGKYLHPAELGQPAELGIQ